MTLVYGTLDDAAVLEEEAAKADVVLHFASADHVAGAEAIARGLKKREEGGKRGCWVHTSGTDVLLLQPGEEERLKKFDDWEGVGELVRRPGEAVISTHSDVCDSGVLC